MSLKELQQLKKSAPVLGEKIYRRNVVVGEDILALACYQGLVKKFGEHEVALVCQSELTPEAFMPKGPAAIRGKHNINFIKSLGVEENLTANESPAVFYKDLKFHAFGGRAKPEKLLWGEDYFTLPKLEIDWFKYFPFLIEENFFARLSQKVFALPIKKLISRSPDDLINPQHYQLVLANHNILECEHLYWGNAPSLLVDLFEDKGLFNAQFLQRIQSVEAPAALYVRFFFNQALADLEQTFFLPLSYTYEQGHFVGEFSRDKKTLEFVTFVDPQEHDEEEISRKLRSLKKILEKVFPQLKHIRYREEIVFKPTAPCSVFDSSYATEKINPPRNVHFVGESAPASEIAPTHESFEYSNWALSHWARGISIQQQLIIS